MDDCVKLSVDQIEELLSRVKEDKTALRVIGSCKSILSGDGMLEIFVDRWPDWRSLVVKEVYYSTRYTRRVHLYGQDVDSMGFLLKTEGLLDWSQEMRFPDIDVKFKPALEAAAISHNGTLKAVHQCFVFTVTEEVLQKSFFSLPDGYIGGELSINDVQRVYDLCIKENPNTPFEFVENSVRTNQNVCIRDSTGNVVGFEFMRPFGAQGMLHVDTAHRRKGLGKYLTLTLARKILKQGMVPYCYTILDNLASINFHQACGYEAMANYVTDWFIYIPPGGEIPTQ